MQHARRRKDAPPDTPDLAAIITQAEGTRARIEDALTRASDPYGSAGLRQAGAVMAGYVEQLGRLSLEQMVNDMTLAAAEGTGFYQGAVASGGRHRASRSRKPGRGQLELIPGEGRGAAVMSGVTAGVAFLRHSTTAKATLGAAAAVTFATVSTSGFTTLPDYIQPSSSHAASTLPVLGPDTAIPVSLPPPDPSYTPGRHAKPGVPDAASATGVPPAPVVTLRPAPPPPPSPPPARPSAPAGGVLVVQTAQVSAGFDGTGQVVFFAEGGALEWHAVSSSQALSLDRSSGLLGNGQSATIGLTVAPGSLAGSAVVTVTAGGQSQDVRVVWVAVPGLGL